MCKEHPIASVIAPKAAVSTFSRKNMDGVGRGNWDGVRSDLMYISLWI